MSAQETTAFYRYQKERGSEKVAQELSALLGQEISSERVSKYGRRREPPKEWRVALGFERDEPPPATDAAADETHDAPGGRRAEQKPKPPDDADFAISRRGPVDVAGQAKERIASLHVFAGASLASALDYDGFQADRGVGGGVAKIWTDRSEGIAEAWISWAEEGNRFAQAFVRMMGTGGAGGNLVLGYAALLGGTAYITGAMPDNEATRVLYGRYAGYRTVVPEPPARPRAEDEPRRNGAAPASAEHPLGDVAAPPGI